MSKRIKVNHIKGTPVVPDYNVSTVRAMTDKEAAERANKDPDAPIINPKFAKKKTKK